MPMIQLIRKDGQVIELEAETINFSITRSASVWSPPLAGMRLGFDTNAAMVSINVGGILTDDANISGAAGASAALDLSRATTIATNWFEQQKAIGNDTIAKVVSALHGKTIKFQSAGQVSAGLGEDITLIFYSQSAPPAATVAAQSIIPVNLTGTINHTGDIATQINNAFSAALVRVNSSTEATTSLFNITLTTGSATTSALSQGVFTPINEKLILENITRSADGNVRIVKSGDGNLTTGDWTNPFFISNFTGGVEGSRKSKGDKLQDLIDMTVNVSAGGGFFSPQSFTGDLIELPDALSSFDLSKLLRIDGAESVRKYIVGMRIPYESMITATGADEVIRQFIIPSGPGVSMPSESNLEPFDPVEIDSNGDVSRPNPFLRQGVAISGVIQTFEPAYQAGDSVWTYSLGFNCCEQLIGL